MGVLYSVFPLDPEMNSYLKGEGIRLPERPFHSRNPSPAELRAASHAIPAVTVDINQTDAGELLQIKLTSPVPDNGPWTLINVGNYKGEASPCHIWFEKGWPELILEVLIRLTRFAGPLVIIPDTGESPLLVTPTADVSALIRAWEHTQQYFHDGSPEYGIA